MHQDTLALYLCAVCGANLAHSPRVCLSIDGRDTFICTTCVAIIRSRPVVAP